MCGVLKKSWIENKSYSNEVGLHIHVITANEYDILFNCL